MGKGISSTRAADAEGCGPPLSNNSSITKGPWTTNASLTSHSLANVSEFGIDESTSKNLPPPAPYKEEIATSFNCCLKCSDEEDNDKTVRQNFIRNVYSILLSQLVLTFIAIYICIFVEKVKVWLTFKWIYVIVSIILFGVVLCTLRIMVCLCKWKRLGKPPGNYICLFVFSITFTNACVSFVCMRIGIVALTAVGVTTLVTLGVVIFTMQSKFSFTVGLGVIISVTTTFISTGIGILIIYFVVPSQSHHNYYIMCGVGGGGALIMTSLQMYGTSLVFFHEESDWVDLSTDDAVLAALTLYMWVGITIFAICSCRGSGRRRGRNRGSARRRHRR